MGWPAGCRTLGKESIHLLLRPLVLRQEGGARVSVTVPGLVRILACCEQDVPKSGSRSGTGP